MTFDVLRLGFNWSMGPFEMLCLGLKNFFSKLEILITMEFLKDLKESKFLRGTAKYTFRNIRKIKKI